MKRNRKRMTKEERQLLLEAEDVAKELEAAGIDKNTAAQYVK